MPVLAIIPAAAGEGPDPAPRAAASHHFTDNQPTFSGYIKNTGKWGTFVSCHRIILTPIISTLSTQTFFLLLRTLRCPKQKENYIIIIFWISVIGAKLMIDLIIMIHLIFRNFLRQGLNSSSQILFKVFSLTDNNKTIISTSHCQSNGAVKPG